MKLSIFYDHLLEACEQERMTLDAVLASAKGCGIDAVEINLASLMESESHLLALHAHAMHVSCIYAFYDWGNLPDLSQALAHVDTAVKVGAQKILVVPGFLPEDEVAIKAHPSDYEQVAAAMAANASVMNMVRTLRQLVTYAQQRQVTVTLEDFDSALSPCATTNELRFFIAQVPGLALTLDMGNFSFSDEDPWQAYTCLREHIVHVHCKDRGEEPTAPALKHSRGLRTVPTGGGYLPIAQIVCALRKDGYDGYFAIEHFGSPCQLETMQRSAKFLRACQ